MTRARPPIGPALAGAVDLSGLKQQAQRAGSSAEAGAPPVATEITEANFETDVLVKSNQVPVVVLLWSPRSEVCIQLAGILAGLAEADAGRWSLAMVNVDVAPRVGQLFGVEAVPTVIALAGGQPLTSFQGPQPADQLRSWIDSLLSATAGKLSGAEGGAEPAVEDPALVAARALLAAGDFAEAAVSYRAVLDTDPGNEEAKATLRQIGFLQRATAQRPDAVAVADAAPGDIEAAFAAADVQILNQDVSAAFDRLIALVRGTAGDDRATVRTRLVELFEIFEPDDPDVVAARRKLSNALY